MNNEVCRDFSRKIMQGDEVIVENTNISSKPKIFSFTSQKIVYFKRLEGRKTIYDVLDQDYKNLITIGRLDYKIEGLLFINK